MTMSLTLHHSHQEGEIISSILSLILACSVDSCPIYSRMIAGTPCSLQLLTQITQITFTRRLVCWDQFLVTVENREDG